MPPQNDSTLATTITALATRAGVSVPDLETEDGATGPGAPRVRRWTRAEQRKAVRAVLANRVRVAPALLAEAGEAAAALPLPALLELVSKAAAGATYGVDIAVSHNWLDLATLTLEDLEKVPEQLLCSFCAWLAGVERLARSAGPANRPAHRRHPLHRRALSGEYTFAFDTDTALEWCISRSLAPATVAALIDRCPEGELDEPAATALVRYFTSQITEVLHHPLPDVATTAIWRPIGPRLPAGLARRLLPSDPAAALVACDASSYGPDPDPADAEVLLELAERADGDVTDLAFALLVNAPRGWPASETPEVRERVGRCITERLRTKRLGVVRTPWALRRLFRAATVSDLALIEPLLCDQADICAYLHGDYPANPPDPALARRLLPRWLESVRQAYSRSFPTEDAAFFAEGVIAAGVPAEIVREALLAEVPGMARYASELLHDIARAEQDFEGPTADEIDPVVARHDNKVLEHKRDRAALLLATAGDVFAGEHCERLWKAFARPAMPFLKKAASFRSATAELRQRWDEEAVRKAARKPPSAESQVEPQA